MRQYSPIARAYISLVILGGILAVWGAWLLDRDKWLRNRDVTSLPELIIGCLLVIVAARIKVVLFTQEGRHGEKNRMSMTVAFVPSFVMIYMLGPFAGVLAGLCTTRFTRKTPVYRALFNAASGILCAVAAALVLRIPGFAPTNWNPFRSVGVPHSPDSLVPLLGILLATVVYYLVNTLLVVGAISLTTGEKPLAMWKHLMWTGPGYFAGASCATVILSLLPYLGAAGTNKFAVLAMIIVAFPIPMVIHFLYKYHSQLDEEKQTRIEALNENQKELEQINVALERSKEELQQLYTSTVESLALAIDAKDRYTKEHIQRVKGIAVAIAQEMGLTGDDLKAVETGALLHDIGKIAVPEHILTKPGRLSDEEFDKIKAHPEMGARILEPVQFPFPVMPIVRHHHERWDGSGYPDGLAGEAIPLGGRILAVADVYDALTSDRSYRRGWSHERSVAYLQEHASSHFDPAIVSAFMKVVFAHPEIFENRSLPALRSGAPGSDSVHDAVASGVTSFEYLALYEISQALSTSVTLDEMLTLLVGTARQLFEASACVILLAGDAEPPLVDDDRPVRPPLHVARAVGEYERLFRGGHTLFGVGATGIAASSRLASVNVFDPEDILTDGVSHGSVAGEPLQSVMVTPLLADDMVIGTLNLYQNRPYAFDGEALHVLEAIAVQAGRALHKAIEFDRTLESALTDALTGLHNARHLNQFLERELERAGLENRTLSVLVLDLDNFKPVNDRYGHTWGNQVLRDLGRLFQSALRSGDLVARYAGDEFVVVLPSTGISEAQVVIDKIRAAVRSYDARPGTDPERAPLRIELSIGVAAFPEHGLDSNTLIAAADREMFRDKQQRKGESLVAAEFEARSLKLVA